MSRKCHGRQILDLFCRLSKLETPKYAAQALKIASALRGRELMAFAEYPEAKVTGWDLNALTYNED